MSNPDERSLFCCHSCVLPRSTGVVLQTAGRRVRSVLVKTRILKRNNLCSKVQTRFLIIAFIKPATSTTPVKPLCIKRDRLLFYSMAGCFSSVHQSNLLEMEVIENRTRRFFRQSPPWGAFEDQLDLLVSGVDRTILLTSGVSTKAEWVMACPSLKKKLRFWPLPCVRAATAVSLSSHPSDRCYIWHFVGSV